MPELLVRLDPRVFRVKLARRVPLVMPGLLARLGPLAPRVFRVRLVRRVQLAMPELLARQGRQVRQVRIRQSRVLRALQD